MKETITKSRIGTSRGRPVYYRVGVVDHVESGYTTDKSPLKADRTKKPFSTREPKAASARGEVDSLPTKVRGMSASIRIKVALFVMTMMAAALIANLFHWHIQKGEDSTKRAIAERIWTTEIPARRGIIRDANGAVLASNISIYSVRAAPRGLKASQTEQSVKALTSLLPNIPEATIRDALTFKSNDKIWNLIATNVDSDTADKIREKDLPGVYLEARAQRTYPGGTSMAHILGFANAENSGAYGVEGAYNTLLKGQPGKVAAERDRAGDPIAIGSQEIDPPLDGADLTLTLDLGIQTMVEKELLKGMFLNKAEAATAIVMDPNTGAILAWVSYPDYNPNEYGKMAQVAPARFRDPSVSTIFEPGSTFKILTAAIGVDTGAVTPDSAADLPGCVLRFSFTVCNWNKEGHKNQTVTDTLKFSSNVGAMWIVDKIGVNRYYDYMKKFGIGQQTGIDLQGEVEGIIRWPENQSWSRLDMDMNSFGQAVSVTPIQAMAAFSAVANGGTLLKPYVVSQVTRNGQVIKETRPTAVRRVISQQTAKTTTDMLVTAVREGETRFADVKGYRVAGKTGTAEIPLPTGGYAKNQYIGSTVAYAPAENPRFVVYVRLDKINNFGSNTAAPIVKTITQELLHYYHIPPTEPVTDKKP